MLVYTSHDYRFGNSLFVVWLNGRKKLCWLESCYRCEQLSGCGGCQTTRVHTMHTTAVVPFIELHVVQFMVLAVCTMGE